jgi:short subunit dehydrogenase-like uncharacterized protein
MMKTLLENPTLSGFRLEAGQLKPTSAFENVAEFDFGDGGRRRCANYPWRAEPLAVMAGTGISTVETYIELPRLIRLLTRYPALARNRRVRRLLLGAARGPTAKQLEQGRSWCVAQTIDENGRRHSSLLSGPDGYRFTAQTVSYAVEQVLGGRLQEGLVTPAQLFGTDPLHAIPGLTLIDR